MRTLQPAAGDEWFGILPAGGDCVPLRFVARFESGSTPDKSNLDYWEGETPRVSPKDMKVDRIGDSEDHVTDLALKETSLTTVPVGSLLIVVRGMILAHSVPVALTTAPVTINQDLKALRCAQRVDPRFLKAVVQGAKSWFVANTGESSHGTKKLETEVIGRFLVPFPPLPRQRAIADFLDAETARIDELIAAKENLLAILAEKRRALVAQAVTRGLDPKVKMRDSGVPWLGEIPAHWQVVPFGFLVDMASGATPSTGEPLYWDGDIPWVSPKEMKRIEIADAQDHVTPLALSSTTRHLIGPPVVLIVVRGMILAHTFRVAITTAPITINQDMKALSPRRGLHSLFLRDFLRGIDTHILSIVGESAHGTRKMETELLGRVEMCVPPIEEQEEIVAYINREHRQIEEMTSAVERSLFLLRERREALIAAVVTGQLDMGVA